MPMNDRKMTGKQTITGGFDLDAFIGGADQPGYTTGEAQERPSELPKPQKRSEVRVEGKKRPERPSTASKRKPIPEPLNERVQILLSARELAKVKEQAGLVPLSKYLRQHLKDSGLL